MLRSIHQKPLAKPGTPAYFTSIHLTGCNLPKCIYAITSDRRKGLTKDCLGNKKTSKLSYLSVYDRISSNRLNRGIVSRSTELVDVTKSDHLSVAELQYALN